MKSEILTGDAMSKYDIVQFRLPDGRTLFGRISSISQKEGRITIIALGLNTKHRMRRQNVCLFNGRELDEMIELNYRSKLHSKSCPKRRKRQQESYRAYRAYMSRQMEDGGPARYVFAENGGRDATRRQVHSGQ
jgi:hypothetical protein